MFKIKEKCQSCSSEVLNLRNQRLSAYVKTGVIVLGILLILLSLTTIGAYADDNEKGMYVIDNERFGIKNDNTDHVNTTNGINDAITWAKENGYEGVKLTDGTYSIFNGYAGDKYKWTYGIMLPSDFVLDLGNATITMRPNDYQCYYMIFMMDVENVTVKGGTLIGERYEHDYTTNPGTHEWGIAVLVEKSSNVTVTGMEICDTTGYGVSLSGNDNVVTDNYIHDCRTIGVVYGGDIGGDISGNTIVDIGFDGPMPHCGIDIEISDGNPVGAYNLKIHDNTITNCYGPGIKCNENSFHYEIYNNVLTNCSLFTGSLVTHVLIHDNTVINEFFWIESTSEEITHYNNTVSGVTTGTTTSPAGNLCRIEDRQAYIHDPSSYVLFAVDENGYLTNPDRDYMEGQNPDYEKEDHLTGATRRELGSAFPEIPEVTAKSGYIFDGWYDENDVKVSVFPATITENTMYTAKFIKDETPDISLKSVTPTAGNQLEIVISISAKRDGAEKVCHAVVPVYDGNGKMISCQMFDMAAGTSETARDLTFIVNKPEGSACYAEYLLLSDVFVPLQDSQRISIAI